MDILSVRRQIGKNNHIIQLPQIMLTLKYMIVSHGEVLLLLILCYVKLCCFDFFFPSKHGGQVKEENVFILCSFSRKDGDNTIPYKAIYTKCFHFQLRELKGTTVNCFPRQRKGMCRTRQPLGGWLTKHITLLRNFSRSSLEWSLLEVRKGFLTNSHTHNFLFTRIGLT